MNKEEIINYFMQKGFLVGPGLFDKLNFNLQNVNDLDKLITNNDFLSSLNNSDILVNSLKEIGDFSSNKSLDNSNSEMSLKVVHREAITNNLDGVSNVNVIFSYNYKNKKKEVQDFVNYFKKRYEFLKRLLLLRPELQDSVSIARLSRKQEGDVVSIIGLVFNKLQTKNDNIILILEDQTGTHQVLFNKNKNELYNLAKDIVLDEVIGISGVVGNGIIFCNAVFFPDIPINHELKKSPDETYAVFISDIHFGIKNFLSGDFMKFIMWLRGEYGTGQQREIANKIKYLFVTGDVVEGVGIYPGQEEDLDIKDIYDQYEEATKYFKMIPEKIKIIICGGNHDAMRMSESQPVFDKNISKGFYEIPNMIIVSNPALVNIHSSEGFPGFDVLMYHGASFPYFADNVPSIRDKGGIFRCDLIMKFLLQKRHLAPSHSSTLYIPDESSDHLVIEKVPDIFVSGHIHQITVSNYRNVSLINSSCWVVQSEDNAKRGIVPHPAKIPLINLKTREIKIMDFLDDDIKVLYSERMSLK